VVALCTLRYVAAINWKGDTGHERGRIGAQPHDRRGDVLRCAKAADGVLCEESRTGLPRVMPLA
jgi:hypothetical protein